MSTGGHTQRLSFYFPACQSGGIRAQLEIVIKQCFCFLSALIIEHRRRRRWLANSARETNNGPFHSSRCEPYTPGHPTSCLRRSSAARQTHTSAGLFTLYFLSSLLFLCLFFCLLLCQCAIITFFSPGFLPRNEALVVNFYTVALFIFQNCRALQRGKLQICQTVSFLNV